MSSEPLRKTVERRATPSLPVEVDHPASAQPEPARPESTLGRNLLVLLGVSLLVLLVYEVGTHQLLERFLDLGARAPLILFPFCLITLTDGWAWAYTLPRAGPTRPSIWTLIWIRLAGEAINNLTPTAYLGGEPVKAMLLNKRGIKGSSGTVSVVVAKTALTVGQIVFILLGIMLTLERFQVLDIDGRVVFVALCGAGAGFVALLVRWQRRGLFVKLARLAERFGLHGERVKSFAAMAPDVDRELGAYYRARGGDFARSTALHFLGWLLGTVEVKLMAELLLYPISWRDAFLIESLSQPLALASAVIPGSLGVREAGGVAIFRFLGLDESVGLALWLLRRLREAVFSVLGLLYLMRATGRSRR
jgi:putative membrane protein